MNKIFRILIILLVTGADMSGQSAKNKLILRVPDHPRILLLKEEEVAVRQNIATDIIWRKLDQFIITECDKIIPRPPVERVLIGRRLLDKSREALRRIFYLSYAWRMTSDPKYLGRAEMEMLAVSAFSDWNPSHFLDVAEMTMAVSIGYDWLYGSLPLSSRSIIKEAIISKGLKPSLLTENSGWAKGSNNWNQVCNAGMTFGALAVFEEDKDLSMGIIERAAGSITLPMDDYEPDGTYPEGYSYWGYGTSFNIMFLSAMEKAFGKDSGILLNRGFLKTASYLENMTGPTGSCFNYSDSGSGGELNPAMFWFASRLNDPSLLWSERYHLENRNPPDERLLPTVMIWGAGSAMNKIIHPLKTIWIGQGKNPVALMRTSWTDRNAIFIGFKSGSPSVNHGHMDVGSFIMESNGVRWAMDFGMQDYNSLETAGVDLWNMAQNSQRWEVFRYNNFVHNTLTVNDQLQRVNGYSSISNYSEKPEMMSATADISSLYIENLKKAVRGITVIDKKYVMVRDEIETLNKEANIRWNMLTSANVVIVGNDIAELTKNGKKLVIKIKSPVGAVFKTRSTVPMHNYDAPNPGTTLLGFEIMVPADSKADLVVLLLPEGATENVNVTSLKLSNWIGKP